MIRVEAGRTPTYCDGHSRRSFLQIGMSGLGSLSLPSLLRAKAASSPAKRDTSVILIWLDGGPSHHDTYDPKPEAPREYAGIWRPIATNVPGMNLTEMFPLQAKIADKFSLIRSVHHNNGGHFAGGHWMLTGKAGLGGGDTAQKHPFFGSIATRVLGPRHPSMPAMVGVPRSASIGLSPGYFGGSYLGRQFDPFDVGGDPNAANWNVRNLSPVNNLTVDRLTDRRHLLKHFDVLRREADQSGMINAMDRFDQQAFDLVSGARARQAFDLAKEDPRIRDRYGRNSWGQSTLLARRLVEAGSTFVTCHFGGWDSHWNHEGTMNSHLPRVDSAVSALFEDLELRGMLDQVLVMVMGEFSRTPKMNDGGNGGPPMSKGTPGRDHWGNALSVLMGGGGIQGGHVIGSTNRLGEVPKDRPLRPGDIHHTVFRILGVDPEVAFNDHAGRPIPSIDHGAVIEDLLA